MSKLSRQSVGGLSAAPRVVGARTSVRRLGAAVLVALVATLGWLVVVSWGGSDGTSVPDPLDAESVASGKDSVGPTGPREAAGVGRDPANVRHAQRTQVGGEPAAMLRFVCAESGVDVACSHVVVRSLAEGERGGELVQGAGMQLGVHEEFVGTEVALEVVADGYANMRASWSVVAGENRLALVPSGSASVRCLDAAGLPVAGVRVALLPPTMPHGAGGLHDYSFDWAALATAPVSEQGVKVAELPKLALHDGVWQLRGVAWQLDTMRQVAGTLAGCADWVQASGKDGMVVWRGLPAIAGYRWGLLPPRIGQVEPVHEQVPYRVASGGGIEVQDPPPYGLSGKFDVTRDARSEHQLEVHEPGSVRGFVAAPAGSTAAAVRLYRVVTVAGSGDNVGLMAFEFAATLQTSAAQGYRFSFSDLVAGSYVVRANWMQQGRDVYFANRAFVIAAGDSVDLGGVKPLDLPHAVTLRLGIAVDGQRQPCEVVYPDVERPMANLYLEVVADSRRPEHSVCELMSLPLDAEFEFHGLPAGRLIARVNAVPGQAFDRQAIARIGRGDFEKRLDQIDTVVAVDVVARSGMSRSLEIFDANGLPLAAPAIWVRRCDAVGRVLDAPENVALQWRPMPGNGQLATELSLPGGDYELACLAAADESGVGMFGSVRASFGAAADHAGAITLRVLPASRASGRAFGVDGEPVRDALHWRAVTGLEAQEHGWPVSAPCAEDGTFALLGIPPGARLIGQGSTPDIDAPQMGLDQVGLRLNLRR